MQSFTEKISPKGIFKMSWKRQILSFILSMLLPWQQIFNTKVAIGNVQENIVNVSNKFRLHLM
jgi:hypothetical protein